MMMRRARSPVSMELPPRPVARSPRGTGSLFRALLFRVRGGRCFPATINRLDAGEHRESARRLECHRTELPPLCASLPLTSGSHCSRRCLRPVSYFRFLLPGPEVRPRLPTRLAKWGRGEEALLLLRLLLEAFKKILKKLCTPRAYLADT